MEAFTILCIILFLVRPATGQADHHDFHKEVFEIALDANTQSLYVGGMNTVYKLTANLTLLATKTLAECDPTYACDNRVRVLEVDNVLQRLLVCGSNGQCWSLDLRDLDKQLLTSEHGSFLPADTRRAGLRQLNHTGSGDSTISRWIVSSPNDEKNRPILSIREILKSERGGFAWRYSRNGQAKISKNDSSFYFDFVDGFCVDKECFYLTLQQVDLSTPRLINRLASVCAGSLFPYVEKPIDLRPDVQGPVLSSDYRLYNRAVGVTLGTMGRGEQDVYIIMVFRKPRSPTSAIADSRGFVLGFIQKSELKDSLNITRMMCRQVGVQIEELQTPDWFAGQFKACPRDELQIEWCPRNQSGRPVIQHKDHLIPVTFVTPAMTGNDDIGEVTSVFTHRERSSQDPHLIIYVATSSGKVFKFHGERKLEGFGLKVVSMDPGLTQADLRLSAPLRPDVALTDSHFYLLSDTTLIRRLLDPCVGISDCQKCRSVSGCGWCTGQSQCRLSTACIVDICPPDVTKMVPTSGPVTGGTILTLHVSDVKTREFQVTICQKPCNMTGTSMPTEPEWKAVAKCRVPESPNGRPESCDVQVKFHYPDIPDIHASLPFAYTVPELYGFSPTRMLGAEHGRLMFRGQHLDSGSDVRVSGNGVLMSNITGRRNTSHLECLVPTLSDPLFREECFDLAVSIDNFDLNWTRSAWQLSAGRKNRTSTLCRSPNPLVSFVQSRWTFRGGNVTVRVKGERLDLAVVSLHLTVSGRQSGGGPCHDCHDVRDGTCLDCLTPDVTNVTLTSSRSAFVGFEMKGRQSLETVDHNDTAGPVSIPVVPDPVFRLEKPENSSCLSVNEHSTLNIRGAPVRRGMRYRVAVEGCPRGGNGSCSILTTSSSSTTLSCSLRSAWECLRASSRVPPACYQGARAGKAPCMWNVEVRVEGRRFPAGCLDANPLPPGLGSTLSIEELIGVVLGVVGGALLFLAMVFCCFCYVRYRKRKFYRKRNANRHSVVSDGALLPSESGGSSEGRYVPLDRLLNPEGDPKKQREIEVSGIIIKRKFLDLGSVVGHGNFGCVFEGHYQREEGKEDSWQKVAVKTLINPTIHAIDLKTFIDEAMLMKNFDHEHVLGLLGLSEGDHGPLVVLPFMERGDILSYVKNEATELTLGDILKFSADIATGMEYLASSKFVHRDLAARNCMLDDDLRVKVADFGLCRDVYEKGYYHSNNCKKLPIRWMPPESIEKGTYTSKSDVWSMGVVMWEMLTRGIMPYPGVEGWDILRYLLAGRRLDQPALCPDAVYALMERCWRLEPWERPTFRDVEHDLRSLTSALQDLSAPYAVIHLHTPITFPDCHRFKDDEAIVAKVKQAMSRQRALNSYSPELAPGSGSGGTAGAAGASVPGSGKGEDNPKVKEDREQCSNAAHVAQGARTSVPVPEENAPPDRRSLEPGPVKVCPQPIDGKDDGYFLLEQEAATSQRPQRSSQARCEGQGDAAERLEPATLRHPVSSARAGEGGRKGDGSAADPVVSWRGVTELRTMTNKDDGYFELERQDTTKV